MRIFLTLKNTEEEWYFSKIARSAQVTFVYLTKFIPKIEKLNLVKVEKKGKKRVVQLTEKGSELAQLLEEIKRKLE